jgi:hypothetical protein
MPLRHLCAVLFVAASFGRISWAEEPDFLPESNERIDSRLVIPISKMLTATNIADSKSATKVFCEAVGKHDLYDATSIKLWLTKANGKPNGKSERWPRRPGLGQESKQDTMTAEIGVKIPDEDSWQSELKVSVFLVDNRYQTAECWSSFGGSAGGEGDSTSTITSTAPISFSDYAMHNVVCVVLARVKNEEKYSFVRASSTPFSEILIKD